MGYQALLFCPDEKLARVVSQVFSELDFTLEQANEPFAAVKKLMSQRYDAVVVDTENEQNASLLFKSARNSSTNQSSLAIALVEGQAGVAKAYRIGANLVLTKPINVEQAKGTLRVARGLLRKNADAAGAAAGAAPSVSPARTASPVAPPKPPARVAPVAPPVAVTPSIPRIESPAPMPAPVPIPSISASARPEEKPAPPVSAAPAPATPVPSAYVAPQSSAAPVMTVPASQPQSYAPVETASNSNDSAEGYLLDELDDDVARDEMARDLMSAAPAATGSVVVSPSGSAAAPAPAKEIAVPAAIESQAAPKPVESHVAVAPQPTFESTPGPAFGSYAGSTPSFGGLSEQDSEEASGGGKKYMIAAVAVLAVAALGYFGYGMLGKSKTAAPVPQAVTAPMVSEQPTAEPAPASVSSATVTPAPAASPATSRIQSSIDKAANPGSTVALRIGDDDQGEAKKPEAVPIHVKSNPPAVKAQPASTDDSAPALPSTVASNDNLSSLISTTPNVAKPSLATVKISQGVSQGLLIKRVQPKYPPAALAVHAEGAVQIEATINKEGNVSNLKVLKGDQVLAHAALEAVRQWRYKPYYLDGEPVEIQTEITVNFKAN